MSSRLLAYLIAALVALIAGPSSAEEGTLSISVGYRERIALPPGAVLEVELLDVSRADAPSVRLSSQRFSMDRVPMAVTLHFDTALIDPRMSYVASARILADGKTLFRTTSAYPVLTRGFPAETDLLLQSMRLEAAPVETPQSISGYFWAVTEIDGRAVTGDDPPTLAFDEDGSFALYGGCNRFRGRAEIIDGTISFPEPFAGTQRACADARMMLERDVLEALRTSKSYIRSGNGLMFEDGSGRLVLRLENRQF